MNNKLKNLLLVLTAIFGFSFNFIPIAPTYADENICNLPNVSQSVLDAAGCGNSVKALPDVVTIILNVVIGLAGLVSVIFIIIGGLNYMTSSGEAAKIEKAKKTILYAVIGLVVCALSFAIANFAIDAINKAQSKANSSQIASL